MRQLAAFLSTLVFVIACAHTTPTASPAAPNSSDAPSHLPSAAAMTPRSEPGHPQLATSPAQLLAPGAGDTIAEALRRRGLLPDGPASGKALEQALRTFQASQGLAATGFPDHETLRKLGIDPSSVDRTEKSSPDAGG